MAEASMPVVVTSIVRPESVTATDPETAGVLVSLHTVCLSDVRRSSGYK